MSAYTTYVPLIKIELGAASSHDWADVVFLLETSLVFSRLQGVIDSASQQLTFGSVDLPAHGQDVYEVAHLLAPFMPKRARVLIRMRGLDWWKDVREVIIKRNLVETRVAALRYRTTSHQQLGLVDETSTNEKEHAHFLKAVARSAKVLAVRLARTRKLVQSAGSKAVAKRLGGGS